MIDWQKGFCTLFLERSMANCILGLKKAYSGIHACRKLLDLPKEPRPLVVGSGEVGGRDLKEPAFSSILSK